MFEKVDNERLTAPPSGIVIGNQLEEKTMSNLPICALRGMIIFLAAQGTFGCYLSAFSIPVYWIPVFCTILLGAFFLSFLYYNKWVLNIGYICFFFTYVPILLNCKRYIRSGYAAIENCTYEVIDNYFILPVKKNYLEEIDNRALAVTIFCCIVGIFYCLILNAIISGYMSMLATFLASFPFLAIGMFFEQTPDTVWYVFVLLSWCMVYVLKRSKLYKNTSKKKKTYHFKHNVHTFTNSTEAKGLLQNCIFLAVSACMIILVLLVIYPKRTFHTPISWNSHKKALERPVRGYVMEGFAGLFDRYTSKGGLSTGQLGGVGSVRNDYETDLVVEFTPYSQKTVYLPDFYANTYEPVKNCWIQDTASNNDTVDSSQFNAPASILKKNLGKDAHVLSGKMKLYNKDAVANKIIHPYYSYISKDQQKSLGLKFTNNNYFCLSPHPAFVEFQYYQSTNNESYTGRDENAYGAEELKVPTEIEDELQKICEEQGFGGTQEEIIQQIQAYLIRGFKYTLSPGKTPKGEDFITYFLNKTHKGYCVYYASAAAMLLRQMHIPTRYAEGYCIPYEKVLDGELVESENYDEWHSGDNSLGKTAVVSVELSDANLHAWVEVFHEGFGWVPYEFTNAPVDQSDASSNAFWDFFSDTFGNNQDQKNNEDNAQDFDAVNENLKKHSKQVIVGFAYLFLILIMLRIGYGKWSWYRKLHLGKHNEKVTTQYQFIYLMLLQKYGEAIQNKPHAKILQLLDQTYTDDTMDHARWICLVKQAAYSNTELTFEEWNFCKAYFKGLKKVLYGEQSLFTRLRFTILPPLHKNSRNKS